MPEANQRRSPRRRIRTGFRLGERREDADIVLTTRDISVGGAFLEADLLLEIGDTIELAFELPGGEAVETLGRVAWVTRGHLDGRTPGMGIEFVDLTPELHARIDAAIADAPEVDEGDEDVPDVLE